MVFAMILLWYFIARSIVETCKTIHSRLQIGFFAWKLFSVNQSLGLAFLL